MISSNLSKTYSDLLAKHGNPSLLWPQWCASPKDEYLRQLVAVGAILVQRTNWRNADRALRNLKSAEKLSLEAISQIKNDTLASLTKPAGFHTTKPRRLIEFSRFVIENYGTMTKMANSDTQSLREKLLDVYGIGPETADTILLYALDKPSFVIDEYTRRWVKKNFAMDERNYDKLKHFFENNLPADVAIFQNFHILIIVDVKGMEGSKMELV